MLSLRPGAARFATVAILIAAAVVSLWLNLPGHLSYDSVVQLAEGRTGVYNGEHPPVMSWLLGLGDALAPGAAAFVVLDTLLVYGALLALAMIAPRVSWLAAPLAAASVCLPQLALYPAIVWKDVLFAGASAAGFAALAWAADRWPKPLPRAVWLTLGLLWLTLAALARQNGAVVLPIGAAAVSWIAARAGESKPWRRGLAHGLSFLTGGAILFFAASAALATRFDDAGATAQAWTGLQTYDLVAATARYPATDLGVLHSRDPTLEAMIRTQGARLYAPARIDSIEPMLSRMDPDGADAGPVSAQWRDLIARDPLLYLRIRATALRWVLLTPDSDGCLLAYTGVDGPEEEMADAGLKRRDTAMDDAIADYALAFARTPAYSHAAYGAIGLASLVLLLRRRRPADLAVAAMLASAFAFTASFALISIACDYRYLYDLDLAAIAAALYLAADVRRDAARSEAQPRPPADPVASTRAT
jgi:hypothetical protein